VLARVARFELTQLRERFGEERSTDVPQPDDECRERRGERRDLLRHRVADTRSARNCHLERFGAPTPAPRGGVSPR
jgi:hypothetical protein